ncbi:MAG: hypothetical protein WA139_03200 [Candidatus Aenigmatarchaeota archaeon]
MGDIAREYFEGLDKGYSKETIKAYEKVLARKYGISDFEKLKQDFKTGLFD